MRKGRQLCVWLTGVGISLLVLGLAPAAASSANISHAYKGAGAIPNGSVVSLNPKRQDYVQQANTSNGMRLLGVAVAGDDSLLAVDARPGTVQVATSGNATTLVSTINGDINVGDQVGVSPFDGVGMKALPGSRVIGLAQTSFNGSMDDDATTKQIIGKNGKTSSIRVGYIRVDIAINTNAESLPDSNLSGLQKIAKSLTGHTASIARVVISLAIAIVATLALITLIYASIYGSIISVGRNPLAKYAVFRTLSSVLAMAALVAIVAILTIFLLLR